MPAIPPTSHVALKEWDSTITALARGVQILILRKGGIHESGGEFELEHRSFVFFPTFLHQSPAQVKPAYHDLLTHTSAEPQIVHVRAGATVARIIEVKSRPSIEAIDDQHIYAKPLIDMRFSYRPTSPLYVVLLRVWEFDQPVELQNTPDYAGCKSWVPLKTPVDSQGRWVLSDAEFAQRAKNLASLC